MEKRGGGSLDRFCWMEGVIVVSSQSCCCSSLGVDNLEGRLRVSPRVTVLVSK